MVVQGITPTPMDELLGCSQSELSRPALRSGVHPQAAARCNEEDATGVAFAVSWQSFSFKFLRGWKLLTLHMMLTLVSLSYSSIISVAGDVKATSSMPLTSGLFPFASRTAALKAPPSHRIAHRALRLSSLVHVWPEKDYRCLCRNFTAFLATTRCSYLT